MKPSISQIAPSYWRLKYGVVKIDCISFAVACAKFLRGEHLRYSGPTHVIDRLEGNHPPRINWIDGFRERLNEEIGS